VNDENNLAQFRVEYLEGLVSRHYFFEASVSHSGRSKPLRFSNSEIASHPKVTVVVIPLPNEVIEKKSGWAIEEYSRDWAMWFVSKKYPDHPVLLSDVDEIPSREQLESGISLAQTHAVVCLPLRVFYRCANWEATESWRDTKLFMGRNAKPGIRFARAKPATGELGSHFRYLGYSSESIRSKYADFAHAEYDTDEFSTRELLDFADRYRLSHVPRFDAGDTGILSQIPKSRATSTQLAVLRFFPDAWNESKVAWSVTRRSVAYFWMNK